MSKKISDFSALTPLDPTDLLEVVSAGANYKTTVEDINSAPLGVNREIDLDGHEYEIGYLDEFLFYIDPTTNSEQSAIRAVNHTGDKNIGYMFLGATDTSSQAQLQANFNGGVKTADILLTANTENTAATHTADEHIFTGTIKNDNANAYRFRGATSNSGLSVDTAIRVTINGINYDIMAVNAGPDD